MIVGVDEVGRGSWAGPVVAGAVALEVPIKGLRDSKRLSKLQRERLASLIITQAVAVGLGWVWPPEVDDLGLTGAVRLAMQRAIAHITCTFDEIIIDGNYNFLAGDARATTLVRADSTVPAVSGASIVAKVARDQWMATEAEQQFPAYKFAQHVGYGTRLHQTVLKQYGVCELHRRSFRPIRALTEQLA